MGSITLQKVQFDFCFIVKTFLLIIVFNRKTGKKLISRKIFFRTCLFFKKYIKIKGFLSIYFINYCCIVSIYLFKCIVFETIT